MNNYKMILIAFVLTLTVALTPVFISNYLENKVNKTISFPKYQAYEYRKSKYDLSNLTSYHIFSAFKPMFSNLSTETLISEKITRLSGNESNYNSVKLHLMNDLTKNKHTHSLKGNLNSFSGHSFKFHLNSSLIFRSDWSLNSSENNVDFNANKIPVLPDEPYAAGLREDFPAMLVFPVIYVVCLLCFRLKYQLDK